MLIHIQDDILRLQGMGVLEPLLADRTTGRNILWATDAYAELGRRFARNEEITVDIITGDFAGIIRTRTRKAFEQQSQRTKQRAEVFTPLWIVERMCDHLDEAWFQRKDGIHKTDEQGRIAFNTKKTWQLYVENRRLEITCGEAPFLTTRYDAVSGEVLALEKRIGLLDRKLRAVSENTDTPGDWFTWALRALRATYGYEFQGDSLLIARINVIMAVWEAMEARWGKLPTAAQLRKAAEIIAWNLWQMDGLTDRVPYAKENLQLSLFDLLPDAKPAPPPYCRIKNWRQQRTNQFRSLKGERTRMKFDFIIGNPPYQEETDKVSLTNGQLRRKSIFHYFQIAADSLSKDASILIYPGGRWIQRSGRGMSDFGLKQINDVRLKKIIFFPKAREVFPTADIGDGISIVLKEQAKRTGGFEYVLCQNGESIATTLDNPGENIIPLDPRHAKVLSKIEALMGKYHLQSLHQGIFSQKLFSIESDFVEKNPDKVRPLSDGEIIDYGHEIKLYTNDKAGKGGRAKWYVTERTSIQDGKEYIDKWKVVVSSANAGGQKRDNQLEIFDNHSVFGRSRLALKVFDTWQEANNFFNYVKSYFVRFSFLMTDENLGTLGLKVPDLGDYSDRATLVDYSKNIDAQLFVLCDLSENEVEYLISVVDHLRQKT